MTGVDETLARAGEVLERARRREIDPPARRQLARVRRAAKISAIGVAAILIAAFVWGLVSPIGATGVMIVALAMLAAVALGVMISREPEIPAAALKQGDLKALPDRTARWLDQQRALLPAPAQRLADGIGVKLQALSPQLATLDEREPAASEIRRLIADELPELVKGYGRVPAARRRESIDGLAPDKQLVDGLTVVDGELSRMSEQLARGDLERLATQGKYLELKYQGDPLG
ncbi:MAG: hypothetical protein H0X36_02470 [Sphingomonadaceae bacterium]|nr:hypothetical protein [Sphingomonadaceae bacterium]